MKVAVSFLKTNRPLKEALEMILKSDANFIHIDLMDGTFVPHTSWDIETIKDIFNQDFKPLDVHLMVTDPEKYLEALSHLNTQYVTIHYEIDKDLAALIHKIHDLGMQAGIAINPETPVQSLSAYLSRIDYVLVMGVNPGQGGQKMLVETTKKLRELRQIREEYQYHYCLSFDGGVNKDTRPLLSDADLLVAGSYIAMSDDYQKQIDSLR